MPGDLKNKVIVITGASSGIGAATARACAAAGMRVVMGARRLDMLQQVAHTVAAAGGEALAVRCDVSKDQDVSDLVNRAVNEYGRLDAVFANAGYGLCSTIADTTDQQTRAMFETNFFGTLRLIHAALPILRHNAADGRGRRGHIVICSSAASEVGLPLYGIYSATKAAQDSVAGALRAELHDTGIAVTSVHPIGTRTEFFDRARPIGSSDDVGLNTPAMMMQSADHVARAIVRCLRRPRPEVWPSVATRLACGFATAFPAAGVLAMRRLYRRSLKSSRKFIAP